MRVFPIISTYAARRDENGEQHAASSSAVARSHADAFGSTESVRAWGVLALFLTVCITEWRRLRVERGQARAAQLRLALKEASIAGRTLVLVAWAARLLVKEKELDARAAALLAREQAVAARESALNRDSVATIQGHDSHWTSDMHGIVEAAGVVHAPKQTTAGMVAGGVDVLVSTGAHKQVVSSLQQADNCSGWGPAAPPGDPPDDAGEATAPAPSEGTYHAPAHDSRRERTWQEIDALLGAMRAPSLSRDGNAGTEEVGDMSPTSSVVPAPGTCALPSGVKDEDEEISLKLLTAYMACSGAPATAVGSGFAQDGATAACGAGSRVAASRPPDVVSRTTAEAALGPAPNFGSDGWPMAASWLPVRVGARPALVEETKEQLQRLRIEAHEHLNAIIGVRLACGDAATPVGLDEEKRLRYWQRCLHDAALGWLAFDAWRAKLRLEAAGAAVAWPLTWKEPALVCWKDLPARSPVWVWAWDLPQVPVPPRAAISTYIAVHGGSLIA